MQECVMRKLECRCAWVAVLTAAAVVLAAVAASAAPIESRMTTDGKGERAQLVGRATTALDAGGITAKLKAFGLSDKQINQRLSQLSSDELQQLATGAEALAAGGAEPTLTTTTWLLIIVIVLILAS
jgi:hypothetical protein